MKVKWLRRALKNLEHEADYIAEESPQIASEFIRHVLASAETLSNHPNMGRPGRITGTRELVVTRFPYILPYRVRENSIEILRVFHTARKWPTQMK